MSHSFTSINIHFVFSPLHRSRIDSVDTRKELNRYIGGICHNLGCVVLASFVMPDHVHLLVRIPGKLSVSEFIQKVKSNSSRHLNEDPGRVERFTWQNGYGAFSCSYSKLEEVKRYIQNQEKHHQSVSHIDEYQGFLAKHEIEGE